MLPGKCKLTTRQQRDTTAHPFERPKSRRPQQQLPERTRSHGDSQSSPVGMHNGAAAWKTVWSSQPPPLSSKRPQALITCCPDTSLPDERSRWTDRQTDRPPRLVQASARGYPGLNGIQERFLPRAPSSAPLPRSPTSPKHVSPLGLGVPK